MDPENTQTIQPAIPVQPVNPPVPPVPTTSRSKLPIILGVIILVLVSVGILLAKSGNLSKLTAKPTPNLIPTQVLAPTPTPDPTADWQTYTNNKALFILQYPQDWKIKDDCINSQCLGQYLTIIAPDYNYPDGKLQIDQINNQNCDNLSSVSWSKPVKKSEITIDGIKGLEISSNDIDFNDNKSHQLRSLCIPIKSQSINISFWSLNNPTQEKQFTQILSTFKFTN
ncbi:hypothetical protein COT44_04225 [Candidatus Shapirobacteria bacterium CG08_land_8_20_14_0_20_39_18]|uniref:Uncharacterized protein n=1 Tax=Candidatus Shapirobacteria bacterium CG08_land_8_20_14_0_20_39_18 TaxID=1974883 RepID=A0A2M6XC76_9BACT|nr:MAG: hypothetical protein COT44_04225 [Candidatus Shapirobacteria bacterium CG08_land_8_20_14_0_20_39_18]PIY66395.1 MAG: hypothetical protein COY91_00440 [Candidatus Shapirobacteria bacterium CG_4_10_14_0_8_um_filter_39_15]PJE68306.1 MAG: hypothetical protein COU94_02465 [Candidatus Shapirobacteria bacterium CG10_big_fil_rev_8_21_14_0_10_38_8]